MRAMTRERRCRMREAPTLGAVVAVAEECAWAFQEWVEVRTAGVEAEAETRAMKTANECKKW